MISNSDYLDPDSFSDNVVSKFACSHCDQPAGQNCHPWCICAKGEDQ